MLNMNSPVVQGIIDNLPTDIPGRVPGYYNPPPRGPRIEKMTPEEIQAMQDGLLEGDHLEVVDHYKTGPHGELTRIGGYISGGNGVPPLDTTPRNPYGVPIYQDATQPVQSTPSYQPPYPSPMQMMNNGGFSMPQMNGPYGYSGLPIQNYHNPYMGMGTSFGPGQPQMFVAPNYNPYMMQQNPYGNMIGFGGMYQRYNPMSPEDMQAKQEGFANHAEKMVNDFSISRMLSLASMRGQGYDEELIDRLLKMKDKEFVKKLDEYDKKKTEGNNPLGFGSYNFAPQKKVLTKGKIRLRRGSEIIGEKDLETSMPPRIDPNYYNNHVAWVGVAERQQEQIRMNQAYMYSHAIERELDTQDSIDFFNSGINLVHHRDKEIEWNMARYDASQYYDRDSFLERLFASYGNPAFLRAFHREKERKRKRLEEIRKEDEKNNIIRDIDDKFAVDTTTGEFTISPPEWLLAQRDRSDELLFDKNGNFNKPKKKEEDFEYRLDRFVKENVDDIALQGRGMSYRMPYYSGPGSLISPAAYGANGMIQNSELAWYEAAKRKFMSCVDQL